MKIVCVIPARYGSSRFPGKPLADLNGRPMLLYAVSHAGESRLVSETVVATESPLIEDLCRRLGIPVLMTSPSHENPTSRLCEAAEQIPADLYVMLGGDEPLLTGEDIDRTIRFALSVCQREDTRLAAVNAMAPVLSPSEAMDTANIKVVCNSQGRGLYLSRLPIPYPKGELDVAYRKFVNIGVYSREALDFFKTAPKGRLETAEDCDLLRFLECGIPVFFTDTGHASLSIDTKKDLAFVSRMLSRPDALRPLPSKHNGGISDV